MPNYAPYTYKIEETLTVQTIYGTSDPKIPEGYEPTGEFRPAREGDTSLVPGGMYAYVNVYMNDPNSEPRIILRKVKTYSDGEILDYVLEWINEVIPGYQVCKLSIPSPRRTLTDRDPLELPEAHKGPAALANALKTCVIEKMRKEGK